MSRNKKLLLLTAAILAIAAGIGVWAYAKQDNQETSAGKPRNTVNYNGPTDEEKQAGDDQKAINEAKDSQVQPQGTATVVIANTSQSGTTVRVRAFVSNAVESDGLCTTTLELGDKKVTKTTQAFADASSTQCGAIDFDRSQLTPGTWKVSVNYTSKKLSGNISTQMDVN